MSSTNTSSSDVSLATSSLHSSDLYKLDKVCQSVLQKQGVIQASQNRRHCAKPHQPINHDSSDMSMSRSSLSSSDLRKLDMVYRSSLKKGTTYLCLVSQILCKTALILEYPT